LRESEKRYRALFEQAADAIVVFDIANRRILDFNDAACQQLGYTRAEFKKLNIADIDAVESEADVERHVRQIIRSGGAVFETKQRAKDGRLLDMEVRAKPVRVDDRTLMHCIWRDITGRKQTEERLRKSEALLRQAFDNAPFEFWIRDLNDVLVFQNKIAIRQWGQLKGARTKQHPVSAEVLAVWEENNRRAKTGKIVKGEVTYHERGVEKTFHNIVAPFIVDGNLEGIFGYNLDITELKRTEADLLFANQKTQQRATETETVLAGMLDAVLVYDSRMNVVRVNRGFSRIYGFDPVGMNVREIIAKTRCRNADGSPLRLADQPTPRALRGQPAVNRQLRITRQDGQERYLETTATPIRTGDQITGTVTVWHDITERKQAEAALKASEVKYRKLLETMTDAFAGVAITGEIREFNSAFRNMLGYSDAELLRMTFKDLTPKKWHAAEAAIIKEQILRLGHSEVYEKEYRHKDGTIFPVELRTFLTKDEAGQPAQMWAVVRNITERKRAEAVLKQFKFMVDEGSEEVYLVNRDGSFKHVNEAAARSLGYSLTEFMKLGVPGIDPNCRAHGGYPALFDRTKAGKLRLVKTWHCAKDGRKVEKEIRTTVISLEGHEYVVGFGHDVTEQRRMEQALRESEARFRQMAETVPEGVWLLDADAKQFKYLNRWLRDYLGLRDAEMSHQTGLQNFIHPNDRARLREAWKGALASGSSHQNETRVRRADGTYHWFLNRAVPLKSEDGIVERWIGSSTDIHLQKTAQAEMERMVGERTEALRENQATLQSFYNSAPFHMGIVELRGNDLSIVFANRATADFLKKRPTELRGRKSSELGAPQIIRKLWAKSCRQSQRENLPVRFEYEHWQAGGGNRWLCATVAVIGPGPAKNPRFSFVVEDITRRKHSEAASRASEEKFRRLFSTVADAVFLVDGVTWRFLEANEAALRLYGYTREEMLRLAAIDVSANPDLSAQSLARALAGLPDSTPRRLHRKKDGTVFPVQIAASKFDFQGRVLLCGIVRDITRQVEMEHEILSVSEREQQRIARDLHDDVCQDLTGVQFLASALAANLAEKSAQGAVASKRIADLLQQTLEKTRELSHGLAPMELKAEGLAVALQQLRARVKHIFHCECRLHCDPKSPPLDPAAGIHLYRIAQEAVTNAIRHGKARRIDITFSARKNDLVLRIADNGAGLSQPFEKSAGMGLRAMQYRASVIGGTLEVKRQTRGGTEVICTIAGNPRRWRQRKENEKS
jgi:PAS domain S-box-containing protein